jgi:hypothetical protein
LERMLKQTTLPSPSLSTKPTSAPTPLQQKKDPPLQHSTMEITTTSSSPSATRTIVAEPSQTSWTSLRLASLELQRLIQVYNASAASLDSWPILCVKVCPRSINMETGI